MIKILDNSKTLNLLVNDTTNGQGHIETLQALVAQELNGIYEAELSVSASDKYFGLLNVGGLLSIPVNEKGDKQIFRIYYMSKVINQVVTIKAQHITYDLSKVPVKPFTATGAVNAKNGMLNNIMGDYPFTMTTDISNTTSTFKLDIPRSFRECLGGYEGSLLDVFRGEYEYDNLTVKMLARRGADNGVRIAYGKNLTDFKQEENIENVYTSVLGYAVVNETTYTGDVYHKVNATYPKVKIVDFSNKFAQDETPTTAKLNTLAQSYADNNDIGKPNVNITVSFVPLYQTEEYKNIAPLERVNLGDTVRVYFENLGVEATSRVVKTVFNVNSGRYESVELGNAKANLNTVINEVVKQTQQSINNSQGFLESQLNEMATLIINGLGLHKTLVDDGDGGYRIYLHNKATLAESDTQYIFTSEGFLVSTNYGQTWNAGFDSSGNAVLNSLATITLKALEINGSTINGSVINGTRINFGDLNGKYLSAFNSGTGIMFNGNGNYAISTIGSVDIENTNCSNRLNTLALSNNSAGNYLNIINWMKDNVGQNNRANWIYFEATSASHSLSINTFDNNAQERVGVLQSYDIANDSPTMVISIKNSDGSLNSYISLYKDYIGLNTSGRIDLNATNGVYANYTRIG